VGCLHMAGQKARDRYFTVMVVPHSASAPLTFRLSLRLIQVLCTVMVFMVVGVVVFLGNYHSVAARAEEVDNLRAINVQQKQQIGQLVAQMDTLQARLAELDEMDQQLRDMLKMDLGYGETSGAVIAAASGTEGNALGIGGAAGPAERLLLRQETNGVRRTGESVLSDPSLLDTVELHEAAAAARAELGTRKASLESVTLALQDQLNFLMARPTGWPAQGIITSNYGWRSNPYGWGREFHDGIDIAAPIGTPIQATADGVVRFVGWKSGYGRTVVVRHGFGFETMYAHNSRIFVNAGDEVSRGDVIASMGSTGRSTGSHVHYEVRRYGCNLNPREFLNPPSD